MVGVHSCCPGVVGRFVFQGSFDYYFGGFQACKLGVVFEFCGFVGKFVGEFVPGNVHVAGNPLDVDVAVHVSSRRHKEATSGLSLSRAAVRDWESVQISTLSCSSKFFSSHLIALSMASFSSS